MKVLFAIYFFLIATTITVTQAQNCGLITTYSPDVCLFDPQQKLDFFDQSTPSGFCEETNTDPFVNTLGFADFDNQDACNTLVRQDGKDCIQLYAEFLCSNSCNRCLQLPCKKFCDTLKSTCPLTTASSLACFQFMPPCSDTNTGCTDWNVDKSKLPGSLSGSTTKASSTTKAASTAKLTTTSPTGTHTTSSGAVINAFFVSMTIVMVQLFF